MSNEDRNRGVAVDKQQHNQYGTFQGVANYPPPRPPRYDVAEGTPVRDKLPCCGIGFGWFLIDDREKAGYIACTIAALLATTTIILSATIKAGG
ncbi:hypothetical protein GOBAR_DD17254 [Gossypium barbadense]|nr:hypothetical protein GOBAR_DD17254 [Gossypium barbadense]